MPPMQKAPFDRKEYIMLTDTTKSAVTYDPLHDDPHEYDRSFGEYDGTECTQCKRNRVQIGGATGRRICEKCGNYQDGMTSAVERVTANLRSRSLKSDCGEAADLIDALADENARLRADSAASWIAGRDAAADVKVRRCDSFGDCFDRPLRQEDRDHIRALTPPADDKAALDAMIAEARWDYQC